MTIAGKPDTPQDTYFEVITGKTAILFAAAAAAGAQIAGASDNDIGVMHDYGLKLGLAFQIMDDAMDYAMQYSRGKPRELIEKFVKMYVNKYTVTMGDLGEKSIRMFFELAKQENLVPDFELNISENI